MQDSSLRFEAVVGLALLEERCSGLLGHLDAHFAHPSGTTEDELRSGYGAPLANADVAASLSWLERVGAVETRVRPEARTVTLYKATELLPEVLREAKLAAAAVVAVRKQPRPEDLPFLVVSWPGSLPPLRSARWRSSRIAIIDLLDSAKSTATMLFPFVDRTGVDEVSAAIQRALERGVAVTLLTRYLRDPQSPNAHLMQRIRFLGEPASRLFRPLQLAVRSDKEQSREVLHAKVMAVDGGERGYVGSANLTGTAMDESLEVGVLVGGHTAGALGALLEEIVALAEAP